MSDQTVLTCADINLDGLAEMLGRFGITLEVLPAGSPIAGSWFGEPEAGLLGRRLIVRPDTPVHSALHESCHLICIDEERRGRLHTNVDGDYDEENAVNYLEITLAGCLDDVGQGRILQDMDNWGYTFRLGSARAWFEQEADDARAWLLKHAIIDTQGRPRWQFRQAPHRHAPDGTFETAPGAR